MLVTIFSNGISQVLGSGKWFKISVKTEGVYKISHDLLKKTGINPSSIDPRTLRIFGNKGGMLPQLISAERPGGLQELPIFVSGEDDGKFDKSDFILFFAAGPYESVLEPSRGIFRYGNNLYADENFYFITVSDQQGKRIESSENLNAEAPLIDQFDDYVYHETDEHNELHSGREWYGEKFGLTTNLNLSFDVPGIVPGSEINVISDVMGQSYADASFKLFLNDVQVTEQSLIPVANGRYSLKGYDRRDTISVNESSFGSASRDEQQFRYEFVKASGFSQGYLDYLLVGFRRELRLYGDETIFTSASSTANPVSTFQIKDIPDGALIWDVTDLHQVRNQQFTISNNTATFSTTTSQLKKFVVFNVNLPSPEVVGPILNQDLRNSAAANLIIVTNDAFRSEADRLAAHRQATGWTVQVVTTEQIFNEFSSGRQDVTAIRDFVKLQYDKNPAVLKALLLFGKGSYDYKDRVTDNTNFVPTYESRNSLHPLQTYSSDDYFGFLETEEGEWPENPARSHSLEIGVGRLPVATPAQATAIVDKIIEYDSRLESFGYWRKKIVFVADDGNSDDDFTSLHQSQADQLARLIESSEPSFDIRKLFMGAYPKTLKPNGESVAKLTEDIVRAFEDGSLIINYTGHGSEQLWSDERVFSDQVIATLKNQLYPFLVTATCEFGRHDDPFQTSSAELVVTRKESGAIGLVTTARPVNATTNFDLNTAFYEALFQRTGDEFNSLADIFKATKNNSIAGVSNRNFSLLADPSMTLALPKNRIQITSVKTENGSDTLKALSRVIVSGYLEAPGGEQLTGFNGIAEASLFNKEIDVVTIGRNDPAFHFKEWSNVLFRGKTSVKDGQFTFEFILPRNISYAIGEGKLSMYAFDLEGRDANGSSADFKIGGTEPDVPDDDTPPTITLFIGDTTFINGGITAPDTYLVARLEDASGINISSYGIGNSIIAILDVDQETFVLNNYYVSETDDFTKGLIRFPLFHLQPGRHTISLKAWDVYNNPASASVDFIVTDGQELLIESLGNYPNPFVDRTTIFFTHNRSGDDLEAQLFIYSASGNLIKSLDLPVSHSEYKVDLLDFDNGGDESKKLPAGLYLARVIVRSLSNGSKNEQVTKLIILN
jgi:hypothetical protein